MGTESYFSGSKGGWNVRMIAHLNLVKVKVTPKEAVIAQKGS
jgi:hypothetical protein